MLAFKQFFRLFIVFDLFLSMGESPNLIYLK